jgi:hypothetical protein
MHKLPKAIPIRKDRLTHCLLLKIPVEMPTMLLILRQVIALIAHKIIAHSGVLPRLPATIPISAITSRPHPAVQA